MRRRLHYAVLVLAAATVVLVLWPAQDRTPDPADMIGPVEVEPVPHVIQLRLAAKTRLAAEVAANRRPLLEAAALFDALDRVAPAVKSAPLDLDAVQIPIRTRTPEEKSCWRVARWVYGLSPPGTDTSPAVARLAAEFRAELAVHGAIHLPDATTLEPAQSLLEEAEEQWETWAHGHVAPSPLGPRYSGE